MLRPSVPSLQEIPRRRAAVDTLENGAGHAATHPPSQGEREGGGGPGSGGEPGTPPPSPGAPAAGHLPRSGATPRPPAPGTPPRPTGTPRPPSADVAFTP